VDLAFLERIRRYELDVALRELRSLDVPSKGRILEVGAGSGWQSRQLAQAGYSVEAVDLGESNYSNVRVWPITNYDGEHIPFPDNEFDVVFSSNVLEHVHGLDRLQKEMWRVLKPDGVALHIVPSATWRLWTNVTYYPAKTRGLILKFAKRHAGAVGVKAPESAPPTLASILGALLPARHGEIGNALSEMFHFSRFTWAKRLVRAGWQEIRYVPNQLVYSGNDLFGGAIQIERRVWLSRYLGGSCHLFILKKTPYSAVRISPSP
jgi:SAM-dependent methyltransferase